jgi:hypothetical protein
VTGVLVLEVVFFFMTKFVGSFGHEGYPRQRVFVAGWVYRENRR